MGEQGDEPGAVGNRLSLDPNDDRWSSTVGEWADGETYNLNMKVRQISPGEFEVVSAKPTESEPADEPPAEEEEEAPPVTPRRKGAYSNPAIENL